MRGKISRAWWIAPMFLLTGWMLVIAGCRTTESVGTQVDDTWITSKIKTKLAADPEINPFNVSVSTNEGVVTLSGRVMKEETRAEAVKLARHTRGVRRVVNDIKVGSSVPNER